MNKDIMIIGGGASALMLGSLLEEDRVTIIESNSRVGAKILISGGGKCNITNVEMDAKYFLGHQDFVQTVLHAFNEKSLLHWLKYHKLTLKLRKDRQYFCQYSAKDLVNIFANKIKKHTVLLDEKVLKIEKKDGYFSVITNKQTYLSKIVVIASGGLSFPKLGASSIGYDTAQDFGHSIIKTAPALVGFTVQKEQFFFKRLSGTSTEVRLRIGDVVTKGALLFTHKGISGPAVLDASLYWNKGEIEIDFLPSFHWDQCRGSKKQVSSLLPLPKRITKAFLVQLGLKDKPYATFTVYELDKLKSLNHYCFAPAGTFGFSKAEVTKGGVATSEIDVNTMMSKKVKDLYFIGEVVNVTGKLGGYNFQWAFSSAYQCFKHISKY